MSAGEPDALAPERSVEDAPEHRSEPTRRIYCRACAHAITSTDQRIAVDGIHEHVQANPHGYIFAFGCFARAPGCQRIGPATTEHCWFPGYAWAFVLCGGCGEHLGWHFAAENDAGTGFFGLILERLRETQA